MQATRFLWLLPLSTGILITAGCSAGTPATGPTNDSGENTSINNAELDPGEEFIYIPGEEVLGELPKGHQYAYEFNDETGKPTFLGVRAPDGTIDPTINQGEFNPGEEFIYIPGEEALGKLPKGHQYAYEFNDETGKPTFLGIRAPDGTIVDIGHWENPLADAVSSTPNADRLAVEAKLEKLRGQQTPAEIQSIVESEKPAELLVDAESGQYVAGYLIEPQASS